ncbi:MULTISPECIES: hypothetical protein [unclassified Streptomyces]|uniref:hypothetical protein n=1 Tax=unclassified Streptomyces TaxID=2593676 RepID=UPI00332A2A75
MKPTARKTLAAVVTGVAVAVGAAATPAAATPTVPVPVPLDAAGKVLPMEMPRIGMELPLLIPGAPEAPRFTEGRLLPDRTLPQVPLNGGLPGIGLRAPLPHVPGDGHDHIDVGTPASPLRALTPGLALVAPLTAPDPMHPALPAFRPPAAGVLAPALRTVVGGGLGAGPGV